MNRTRLGITLIEIILAVGILAFALIPIAGVIGQGLKGTQKNYRDILGVQLIEGVLNQAVSARYEDIPVGNAQVNDITLSNGGVIDLGSINKNVNTYNVSLTVREVNVSFKYQPIKIGESTFNPNDTLTWQFDVDHTLSLDGSSAAKARRVKEIIAAVQWQEPNGVNKNYRLKSYLARLED